MSELTSDHNFVVRKQTIAAKQKVDRIILSLFSQQCAGQSWIRRRSHDFFGVPPRVTTTSCSDRSAFILFIPADLCNAVSKQLNTD